MFSTIIAYRSEIQEGVIVLLFAIALWRGAAPERIAAGTFCGMVVVDRLYHLLIPGSIGEHGVDFGHLAIDLVAVSVLVRIALTSNRFYPICLAALQAIAMLSHPIRALNVSLEKGAYFILMIGPSYLQLVTLAIGIALHIRREKRFGPYPSWQTF